jgi:hypothetical protein
VRTRSHDHERAVQRDGQPGQESVLSRVDLGDDRAGALQQQALERRRTDERIEHVPERHPTSSAQREQPRSRRDGASEEEV